MKKKKITKKEILKMVDTIPEDTQKVLGFIIPIAITLILINLAKQK